MVRRWTMSDARKRVASIEADRTTAADVRLAAMQKRQKYMWFVAGIFRGAAWACLALFVYAVTIWLAGR